MTLRRRSILASGAGAGNEPRSGDCGPSRTDIEAAERTWIKDGAPFKADIFRVDLDRGRTVVKDFKRRSWPIRLLGRIQIAHECSAYRWLGATSGVPRFFGRIDPHALAVEYVEGVDLFKADDRFSARQAYVRSLRRVVGRFIALGFIHLDVRSRENVMACSDGEVVVIDMAGTAWVRPGTLLYRLIRPLLVRHYRTVLHKWRKLLSPGRRLRDERSRLMRFVDRARMPHRWVLKQPPEDEEDPDQPMRSG